MPAAKLPNEDLTTHERKAYEYFIEHYERTGDAPRTADVARHLDISFNAGKWILGRLEAKGFLKWGTKKVTVTRLKPTKKAKAQP